MERRLFQLWLQESGEECLTGETWGFCSGFWITSAGEGAYKFDLQQHEIRKVTAAKRRSWQGLTKGIMGHFPRWQETPLPDGGHRNGGFQVGKEEHQAQTLRFIDKRPLCLDRN